jgi:hypothetical protein
MSGDSDALPIPKWPPHFPDDCPPQDAFVASGAVFRAVKADPLSANDFLSYLEEEKPIRNATKRCQASGVSVQRTLEEARRHLATLPGVYKYIAAATLMTAHGKMKPTPNKKWPEHLTWWPFAEVVRQAAFRVIE